MKNLTLNLTVKKYLKQNSCTKKMLELEIFFLLSNVLLSKLDNNVKNSKYFFYN